MWQHCCFRADIQLSLCNLYFLFQQFLTVTTNTAATEVTLLCLPATKKNFTSISVAGQLAMNTFVNSFFQEYFSMLSLYCTVDLTLLFFGSPKHPEDL